MALLFCATAAAAEEIKPLIDRPVTLPQGTVDLTLHSTYTNWDGSAFGFGVSTLDGATLALSADFGVTDRVQLGLGLALPISPGAGFGSLFGSALFSGDPRFALRVDGGYERIGLNGDNTGGSDHANRYFGGFGAAIKVPITPTIAFVTGRSGAVHFGHFNNVGEGGTGLYDGASLFTELSSDFLIFSGGSNGSGTNIGINLPAGLLLQPDPHLALTLQAGYSVAIITSGSARALHFIPLGFEAVVTPAPRLDIGARFVIDGYVAQSGGVGSVVGLGYFDLRALMLWLRVHV